MSPGAATHRRRHARPRRAVRQAASYSRSTAKAYAGRAERDGDGRRVPPRYPYGRRAMALAHDIEWLPRHHICAERVIAGVNSRRSMMPRWGDAAAADGDAEHECRVDIDASIPAARSVHCRPHYGHIASRLRMGNIWRPSVVERRSLASRFVDYHRLDYAGPASFTARIFLPSSISIISQRFRALICHLALMGCRFRARRGSSSARGPMVEMIDTPPKWRNSVRRAEAI